MFKNKQIFFLFLGPAQFFFLNTVMINLICQLDRGAHAAAKTFFPGVSGRVFPEDTSI